MSTRFGRGRLLSLLGPATFGVAAVGANPTTNATTNPTTGVVVDTVAPPPAPPAARPSARPPAKQRAYVPPPGVWARVRPAAVGWDRAKLREAFDYAGEHTSFSMTMVLGGRVLAEHSWRLGLGFARDVAAVQKSVVALLVGNLQAAGRLHVDDPVTTYLGAGWSRASRVQEAPITVRHLLTMTSGLSSGLTFEAVPGSRWVDNTNAYQQLVPLVERVAGGPIDDVTRRQLFDPIGVSATSRWRDRPPDAPHGVDPYGRRIRGLEMTSSDMARVGLLVQRRGMWGTERVLDDPDLLDAALDSSQELNPAYGHLWWLNGKSAHVLSGPPVRRRGGLIPTAPDDLVAALGAGDQKIYVSRSLDLVVTRTGASATPRCRGAVSEFDAELWQRIMAAAPARRA